MKKQLAVWTLFGLAFVVNPNLACSSSEGEGEEDFTYSEADMKAAVLGDWQGTAEIDGESIAFTLTLEQASSKSTTQSISAPTIRPQCAQRSFVRPAGACISQTSMPLVGTIESADASFTGVVTADANAGLNLVGVSLDIQLADDRSLSGVLEDQTIESGEIYLLGTGNLGTFKLSRP